MKLLDLNPAIEKHGEYEHLAFDCPKCGSKDPRLEIPLPPHPKAWRPEKKEGEYTWTMSDLTLRPSIDFKHGDWNADDAGVKCHSHFYITNGEIEML